MTSPEGQLTLNSTGVTPDQVIKQSYLSANIGPSDEVKSLVTLIPVGQHVEVLAVSGLKSGGIVVEILEHL